MNSTQEWIPSSGAQANGRTASRPTDDSRLIVALKDYVNQLEEGQRPSAEELKSRHPELGPLLDDCLQSLDWVRSLAPRLHPSPAESPPLSPLPGGAASSRLGDFEILREIGRGGMGVVYEAMQLSLSRRVALKVLPFAASLDPRQIQRFKNEAQAAAYLHHPNIVPIFGVGVAQGVHYYAMQFIEGQTLAVVIQEFRRLAGLTPGKVRRLTEPLSYPAGTLSTSRPIALEPEPLAVHPPMPPSPAASVIVETLTSSKTPLTDRVVHKQSYFRRVAQLGLQAACALEHAHQHGVVHRDIKPANLLVDVRGNLWITDFGLAYIRNSTSLTISGDLMGTLRYMSPEQALAKRNLIDHRTDIYSLGVTLYEIACLEPAFDSGDRQELLRNIAFDEPRRPRRVNPDIPTELETIILKAMEKNVAERYASAQDLADDLRRYMDDKPILAKRPTITDRLWKWTRRHRSLVMGVLSLTLLALIVMALTIVEIASERDLARQAHVRSVNQEKLATYNGAKADQERARAEYTLSKLRHAVTSLLAQLDARRWSQLPEVTEIRKAMAERLLVVIQGYLSESTNDPVAMSEAAALHLLMGNVFRVQGNAEKSLAHYTRSVELRQVLLGSDPQEEKHAGELAFSHHSRGVQLHCLGRHVEAAEDFERAAVHYESAVIRKACGVTLNNFSWFLSTCPDPRFRDAAKAVQLARTALSCDSCCGNTWNTLGVALYRAGDWKQAISVLNKSMELQKGGCAFDWFALAMAHWQLGEHKKAREWYEKAMQELEKTSEYTEPIAPFQRDCQQLLGIDSSPPPKPRTMPSDDLPRKASDSGPGIG